MLLDAVPLDGLGVHFLDFHTAIVGHAAVDDRFVNRFVSVLQLDIFAHHTDADAMLRRDELADDFLPVRHLGWRHVQAQKVAHQVVHALTLEHERHLVNRMVHVFLLDHGLEWHVAIQGDFLTKLLVERFLAAANDDVRGDANLAQLGH